MVNSIVSYSGLSQAFSGEAMAVVRLPDPKLKTLGERGIECIFDGYDEHSKAFRFYLIKPNESALINSIIESKDAIFDGNRLSLVHRPRLRIPNGTEDIGGLVVPVEVTKETGKDFRKKSGIDYFDTYDPVARISIIRLLVALASIHNLIIHQMDVKTAFLKGELDEEIYMNQPRGFIENKVYKLIKSLYGLKQVPKQWHQKFDEVVLSSGYLLNQDDKCVYSKLDKSGKGVIICLYVDDMLIFGTDQVEVDLTKEFLSLRFSMKDTSTPMDTSEKLMPNNGQAVSQLEYSRVIGCLMYAMTCIRHDIAFAVGKLSSLTYTGYSLVLEGYTNASWISNIDHLLVAGYSCLVEVQSLGLLRSKLASPAIRSEFVALATAGKEAEWLKNLILEIPLWSKPITHISIICDSAATLANAYSKCTIGSLDT
ncbi:zinc finger, CCHC-type containing protein [Tanacetum coccineum]